MSTALGDGVAAAIEEMKALLGLSTDAELADALGVQKTAVAQWRRRGRIPAHAPLMVDSLIKSKPLDPGAHEDAFPAVVGMYALMLCLLLAPSPQDITKKDGLSKLWDIAANFDELRAASALSLARTMREEGIEVDRAFELISRSPDRLSSVLTLASI